jgi:hypothetical protein
MKTTILKILIVLFVLSPVLTMAASPQNHGITTTAFTGSEAFVALLDPGVVKIVDGKTITTGLVVLDLDSMSDPRVSGEATATVNSVYDGPPIFGTGPLWGIIHISNADGGWNVRFAGHQYDNCQTMISAHGSGEGAYEGMHAVWEYQSSDCMLTVSVSGYITVHE